MSLASKDDWTDLIATVRERYSREKLKTILQAMPQDQPIYDVDGAIVCPIVKVMNLPRNASGIMLAIEPGLVQEIDRRRWMSYTPALLLDLIYRQEFLEAAGEGDTE